MSKIFYPFIYYICIRYHVQSIQVLHRGDNGFKSHIVEDRSQIAFIDSPICGLHWDADMMSRWRFRIVPSQHRTLTLARTPAYSTWRVCAIGINRCIVWRNSTETSAMVHDSARYYAWRCISVWLYGSMIRESKNTIVHSYCNIRITYFKKICSY